MPWVKLATGYLRDEKIHFIIKKYGHDTMVVWTGLLTECRRGVLEMDEEIFAEICVMDMQRFTEIKKTLMRFGLVTQCNGEKLKIANWDKYQFSDSYERVKAHRERHVTERNGTETKQKPNVAVEVDSDTDSEETTTTAAPRPAHEYPAFFENAWIRYPNRAGSNPKPRAFKAWKARIKSGESQEAILEGVLRYAAFCKATGKLSTEYVMQAATFFGPDKRYAEPWTFPIVRPKLTAQRSGPTSDSETIALGRKHKIEARPGESMDQYRTRLNREIDARARQQGSSQ